MLLCFAPGCDHTSIRPAFKNFGYVCLKMVTLIDILAGQNFTFFFRFYLSIFWFYKGVLCCLVAECNLRKKQLL